MTPTHQTVRLERGRHSSPADGACVMELASMLAGEPFTDRPRAVCPVIGEFLRTYNDALPPPQLDDLYEYAARVVGTRGPRKLIRDRKRMCLDAARRPAHAGTFRRLLTSRRAAGRAAARSFIDETGCQHPAALVFLDALIDRRVSVRGPLEQSAELEKWTENLARLDSH